jgi:hypothetical protein
MYSYMLKHTTILPYRSIRLYILLPINMGVGIQKFPVTTAIATLAIALATTTNTMTKQPFAFEGLKHYNTDEALLLQRKIQRQSTTLKS